MFMYWLLVIFAGFLLGGLSPDQRAVHESGQLQDQSQSLQATQMVRYMNRINDWRYLNPAADNISVSDAQLSGWSNVPGLSNVIANGRTYVWRIGDPGLMAELMTQTRRSALAGRVVSRRLLDNTGTDMQLTVPAVIPDGSVVWVN